MQATVSFTFVDGERQLCRRCLDTLRSIDTVLQGKPLSHGIGQITLLGAHDNSLSFTLVLANGDSTMQGDIAGLQTGACSRIAVTGGTGRYAKARGFTDTRQIADGVTDLVIHLNPRPASAPIKGGCSGIGVSKMSISAAAVGEGSDLGQRAGQRTTGALARAGNRRGARRPQSARRTAGGHGAVAVVAHGYQVSGE